MMNCEVIVSSPARDASNGVGAREDRAPGQVSPLALRVLVVEDETMIALLIEDMLADLGCDVVATAAQLESAVTLAAEVDADVAILDINLRGRTSFPVADILRARGIPFFFATAYGSGGLTPAYAGTHTVKKPFVVDDLRRALSHVSH